ncbi:MAG TPA: hypothetical protein VFE31_00220 [Opitutaceae bacterium]|nr:hypothetical protein [Opitutaceae bacterium]
MNLQAIINHIADQADEFLDGVADRAQARAGIEEVITADYPSLPPEERAAVVAGVMRILDQEGFLDGMREPRGEADKDADNEE